MPYVNIQVTKDSPAGATAEQKQRIIAGVTSLLEEVLGKAPATTYVVIQEIETDNWGAAGQSVTQLRANATR